jgi:hypothetical protein
MRIVNLAAAAVCTIPLMTASMAVAQDGASKRQRTPTTTIDVKVKNEGEYGGVKAGAGQDKDNRSKRAVAKGALSWIGFAAKNGGAEVFFQSAAPFEIEQRVDGGVLSVRLIGLSKLVANTKRAIDTRYFDNPLARIAGTVVKGSKPGINVKVTFKNPKDAKIGAMRTATEADGLYYVYLSFAEGADAAATPAPNPTPE